MMVLCDRSSTCGHTRQDSPGCYCCAGIPHPVTAACGLRVCPNDKQPCQCVLVDDQEVIYGEEN
jgi:hypothetical protein